MKFWLILYDPSTAFGIYIKIENFTGLIRMVPSWIKPEGLTARNLE